MVLVGVQRRCILFTRLQVPLLGIAKTSIFPDGSVLVKEVYQAATGEMQTGVVSRAQTLKGWFVMVKESKEIHPGNPLWGEGWVGLGSMLTIL